MRLAVTGAGGMLGRDFLEAAAGHEMLPLTRRHADLAEPDAVERALSPFRPALVVHLAAYTDVDGCERRPERARRDNTEATAVVAAWAAAHGARLLFVSTDYVFDGSARSPIPPEAPVAPLNEYGRSKAAAERAVAEAGADALIVRTSWLIGPHGRNFVESIRARAAAGEPLAVVDDQRGSPTFTFDFAPALLELGLGGERGILHLTNQGECTWHELALEVARQEGWGASVARTTSRALGRPARRPAYSVLDCGRAIRVLGRALPPWRESLAEYLRRRPGLPAAGKREAP